MKNKLLKDFLKKYSIEDVQTPVEGEANEYSTDLATYFFGNGELVISPVDESQDEIVYWCDRIGFDYKLVEI